MAEVKEGEKTTELKVAQGEKVWGIIATVVGLLVTLGATVAEALGTEAKAGIIAGAVVAVAGIIQKTLVSLGYIKSRTDVKVASELKK